MIFKYLYYGLFMAWIRIKGIGWNYLNKFKGKEAAWRFGQEVFAQFSRVTIKVVGMDIHVKGKENIPEGTCVFMGNHQSILDIPVLRNSAGRTIDFVAKKELLKVPVVGYWISHINSVALDRENPREGIRAINKAVENVKEGYTFAVFPEGTRSKDGKIHEFKKGSGKIATKPKVPIVPFVIKGTSACFEDNKKFIPGRIDIIFGEPIETENLTRDEEKNITETVYEKVISLEKEIEKKNI